MSEKKLVVEGRMVEFGLRQHDPALGWRGLMVEAADVKTIVPGMIGRAKGQKVRLTIEELADDDG